MPRQPAPPPLTSKLSENASQSYSLDYDGSTIKLTQEDIRQIGRFVREFVTMSLIPWMEKCVVEWNENVCQHSHIPFATFAEQVSVFIVTTSSISTVLVDPSTFRCY